MDSQTLNINKVIDEARFAPFHWKVLFWCLLIIIFDGHNLITYGVALPLVILGWLLTTGQSVLLASSALFGMMFVAGAISLILFNTFVTQYYPIIVRTTAISWASNNGRIGAIVGSILTSALLILELNHQTNFLFIVIPGVITAIAIFLVTLQAAIDNKQAKTNLITLDIPITT